MPTLHYPTLSADKITSKRQPTMSANDYGRDHYCSLFNKFPHKMNEYLVTVHYTGQFLLLPGQPVVSFTFRQSCY